MWSGRATISVNISAVRGAREVGAPAPADRIGLDAVPVPNYLPPPALAEGCHTVRGGPQAL